MIRLACLEDIDLFQASSIMFVSAGDAKSVVARKFIPKRLNFSTNEINTYSGSHSKRPGAYYASAVWATCVSNLH
ncbi:MAG: hypothetical protein K8F91_14105 [Candidatus Obscuribacterales bacterium]|nr:hypothetical protein [Candidatus Obscuribacterales bacterium]